MWKQLLARVIRMGKEWVRKPMQQLGVKARGKRKFKGTTDSDYSRSVAQNLLERNFTLGAPNVVGTSDVTCVTTGEDRSYLAMILDLFDRQVVCWSMTPQMRQSLVVNAWRMG